MFTMTNLEGNCMDETIQWWHDQDFKQFNKL